MQRLFVANEDGNVENVVSNSTRFVRQTHRRNSISARGFRKGRKRRKNRFRGHRNNSGYDAVHFNRNEASEEIEIPSNSDIELPEQRETTADSAIEISSESELAPSVVVIDTDIEIDEVEIVASDKLLYSDREELGNSLGVQSNVALLCGICREHMSFCSVSAISCGHVFHTKCLNIESFRNKCQTCGEQSHKRFVPIELHGLWDQTSVKECDEVGVPVGAQFGNEQLSTLQRELQSIKELEANEIQKIGSEINRLEREIGLNDRWKEMNCKELEEIQRLNEERMDLDLKLKAISKEKFLAIENTKKLKSRIEVLKAQRNQMKNEDEHTFETITNACEVLKEKIELIEKQIEKDAHSISRLSQVMRQHSRSSQNTSTQPENHSIVKKINQKTDVQSNKNTHYPTTSTKARNPSRFGSSSSSAVSSLAGMQFGFQRAPPPKTISNLKSQKKSVNKKLDFHV